MFEKSTFWYPAVLLKFERFGPFLPHLNGLQHSKVLKTTFEKSTFWNPAVLGYTKFRRFIRGVVRRAQKAQRRNELVKAIGSQA